MLECYTSNLLSQGCHEWIDEVLNVKPKLCSYLMLKVEGSTHTHTHTLVDVVARERNGMFPEVSGPFDCTF